MLFDGVFQKELYALIPVLLWKFLISQTLLDDKTSKSSFTLEYQIHCRQLHQMFTVLTKLVTWSWKLHHDEILAHPVQTLYDCYMCGHYLAHNAWEKKLHICSRGIISMFPASAGTFMWHFHWFSFKQALSYLMFTKTKTKNRGGGGGILIELWILCFNKSQQNICSLGVFFGKWKKISLKECSSLKEFVYCCFCCCYFFF